MISVYFFFARYDFCILPCAGGGYVITPINQGKESVVKHMLAIDWKLWVPRLFTSAREHITIRMLERVAGRHP